MVLYLFKAGVVVFICLRFFEDLIAWIWSSVDILVIYCNNIYYFMLKVSFVTVSYRQCKYHKMNC